MSEATANPAAGEAVTPANTATDPANVTAKVTDQNAPDAEGDDGQPDAAKAGADDEPRTRKPSKLDTIKNLRDERRTNRTEIQRLRAENERLKKPLVPDVSALDYDERERLRVREGVREERIADNTDRARELAAKDRSIAEQEFNATVDTVMDKIGEAKDRFPDLATKIEKINLSQDTVEYLAESEKGAELANHLVSNPDLADRLYHLTNPRDATSSSLREADRLIARIEAGITKPTARKATNAPNPGTQLAGGNAVGGGKPFEQMTDDEASAAYRERRKKVR